MTRTMPLDDQMLRLRRQAREREEKLGYRVKGDAAAAADRPEEDKGAAVDEHADTWGFSWMPAIEDFVNQAAEAGSGDSRDGDVDDVTDDDGGSRSWATGTTSFSRDGGGVDSGGSSSSAPRRSGVKRGRPPSAASRSPLSLDRTGRRRKRREPRPPSYNEILLADKSFHNPHASETMADAFGILRPASFVLDVGADDRPLGGAPDAAAATVASAIPAAGVIEGDDVNRGGRSGGGGVCENRSWFYDTVRDRQNRLWADTRVRKGVELARKGQHQTAIENYTQALGMCPDHDDGLVARGAAFATTGRLRQAVQDLSRALSINPQNSNADSYLRETRRRMERQDTRESPPPGSTVALGAAGSLLGPAGLTANGTRLQHNGKITGTGTGTSTSTASMTLLPTGSGGEASTAALRALIQDGAEGDALRKMRVMLEEDERKRKRAAAAAGGIGEARGGEGGAAGEEGRSNSSSRRKKKSRKKKDRKSSSSSKSKRSSSRHKKGRRRESAGGGSSSSSNSSSSSSGSDGYSSAEETDARSSSSRKKKKHKKRHHKHRKRSSAKKASGSAAVPGFLSGGGMEDGLSARFSVGGVESEGEEEAHPILQRKKHSLWG